MKSNLFHSDSGFWRAVSKLSDVLGLSLLFLICSLPVVTLGASAAALYDCTVHNVRKGESGVYARFFGTFKNEWKTGALTTLLWIAIWVVLYFVFASIVTGVNAGVRFMIVLKYAFLLCALLPAGVTCWLFPLLSRFTQSFGALNRNAAKIALSYLPRTLLCALIAAALIAICALWIIPLLFCPCVMMLLLSLLMEPVMEQLSRTAITNKV